MLYWAIGLAGMAAWLTHIITAIAAQAWLFMVVGALIAPVAIAHGVSVWLGFNWLHQRPILTALPITFGFYKVPLYVASFHCAKGATETEIAICNNPKLKALDGFFVYYLFINSFVQTRITSLTGTPRL